MNAHTNVSSDSVDDDAIEHALLAAVQDLSEISTFTAHDDLDALSTQTIFTGIDVFEDAIVKDGNKFAAPATVYVELNYGGSKDGVVMGDSFPGTVTFKYDGKAVELEDIIVDTSSFYK